MFAHEFVQKQMKSSHLLSKPSIPKNLPSNWSKVHKGHVNPKIQVCPVICKKKYSKNDFAIIFCQFDVPKAKRRPYEATTPVISACGFDFQSVKQTTRS